MSRFEPDYRNLVDAAYNRKAARVPLYTHGVDPRKMEEILDVRFFHLLEGSLQDKRQFFRRFNHFHREMGYDTVSWERGVCSLAQGGYGLTGQKPGIIRNRADLEAFPFDESVDRYFAMWNDEFSLLREEMPEGMKAVGGVGNGIFEVVQDFAGYESLAYMRVDDPELYSDLFARTGELIYQIWSRFLKEHGDTFAVCRIGDDLGFKTATLLTHQDIRSLVVPQYQTIVELIHSFGKPFLFHSCGNIFDVMDDFIDTVQIDAKHSNEDVIAPFSVWVERYGDRIGNFGGLDMDLLCRLTPADIERRTVEIIEESVEHGGFAFGEGNSVPDYVPAEGYSAMINAARRWRGDFKATL